MASWLVGRVNGGFMITRSRDLSGISAVVVAASSMGCHGIGAVSPQRGGLVSA